MTGAIQFNHAARAGAHDPKATLAKVLATMQAKRYRAAAAMLLTGFHWNSVPGYGRDDWHMLWFQIDRMESRPDLYCAPVWVQDKLERSRVIPR